MVLEDFFTLTEMKYGLNSLVRVDELIATMQEQKNSAINSFRDVIRQWSTVGNILAVTDNRDCYNRFDHLNGLLFLNEWLQEAQNKCSDIINVSVEEFISLLLGTFQRLPVDREKALSSGIGPTVQKLFHHSSKNIADVAKILLKKWSMLSDDGGINAPCYHSPEKADSSKNESKASFPVIEVSSTKQETDRGSSSAGYVKEGFIHNNIDACQTSPEVNFAKGIKDSEPNWHFQHSLSSSYDACGVSGDLNSLVSSLHVSLHKKNALATEESSICPTEGIEYVVKEVSAANQLDFSQKTASDVTKQMEIDMPKEPVSFMSSQKEVCIVSSSSGLSSSFPHAVEPVKKCSELDSNDSGCCSIKGSNCPDNFDSKEFESSRTTNCESPQVSDLVKHGLLKHVRKEKELELADHDSSGQKSVSSLTCFGTDSQRNAISMKENNESYLEVKRIVDSRKRSRSPRPKISKNTCKIDQMRADVGLEYGVDAIEFAVLIAEEAKCEVTDREQCSSSREGSSGDVVESDSVESEECKSGQISKTNKLPAESSHSDDDTSMHKNISGKSEKFDAFHDKDHVQNIDTSKFSSIIQKPVECAEKTQCSFDLNISLCIDDTDHSPEPIVNYQSNFSESIAVAAQKGSPAFSMTSLNFEGEPGSKESACGSTLDDHKTILYYSKKLNVFKIDLNISEAEDDTPVYPSSGGQFPVPSKLHSGDCMAEVIPKKSERIGLDLNCLGDEETYPNLSSFWRNRQQKENHTSLPTSSSSRQAAMREIDLNNNLHLNLSKHPLRDENARHTQKLDDSVITIMGSRFKVERNDPEPTWQTHRHFLVNGLSTQSTVGVKPLVYSHVSAFTYGHDGLPVGQPALSTRPILHGHGSDSYIVDTKGSTSISEVLGSSREMNASSYRPQFLAGVVGVPPGLSTFGSSQPGFNLNSGTLSMESGSMQNGSFTQFFMPGEAGITEEQIRTASRPASGSSLQLKRKEPEFERESYPFSCKQVTSRH